VIQPSSLGLAMLACILFWVLVIKVVLVMVD